MLQKKEDRKIAKKEALKLKRQQHRLEQSKEGSKKRYDKETQKKIIKKKVNASKNKGRSVEQNGNMENPKKDFSKVTIKKKRPKSDVHCPIQVN